MTKIKLSTGVAWISPATSKESADAWRRVFASNGLDTTFVLDPFEEADLVILAGKLNEKYELDLRFDEEDLADLRFAIGQSAGARSERSNVHNVNHVLRHLARFTEACEDLINAASQTESGLVNMDHKAPIDLVAEELVRLGVESTIGNARARIANLYWHMRPLLLAAGAVTANLVHYAAKVGRPQGEDFDPLCIAVEGCLEKHGVKKTLASDPYPERPGALVEMAITLQKHLPETMRSEKPSTWAQRFKAARRRAAARGRSKGKKLV